MSKEACKMWMDLIRDALHNNSISNNFRPYSRELTLEVQRSLGKFCPIDSLSYENNPIQLIDFFSGAGGTSLGFAALNSVLPVFKMLGGCDINEVSATTYMKKTYFPSNSVLEEAVLNALKELGGEATTEQINLKVIEILSLPDEIVQMEDESGLGTKLNYRLRWSRTNLKSRGQIKNIKRGTWSLD